MSKIYFTLTGTKYYHGNEFMKPGMKLKPRRNRITNSIKRPSL